MVNTVSALGLAVDWTEALATEAPGMDARAIQSSGMTKRAKTFPLRPLPFSPAGEKRIFAAAVETLLSEDAAAADDAAAPEDATVGSEST
jgi:hypothetical protein